MKQKTLHVDFNDSTLGTIAREGEHNRTQLVFVLDEVLQACDFINVEFGVESSGDKLVLENLCPEEGESTLKVSLTQDVTVSGALAIQLIGYVIDSETAEPQIIAKSPVVSGAVTPSINGIKKIAQGTAELLDRILAKLNTLLDKAHTHRNHKTLEGFYCESLETGFATDVSSTELKWQSKPIAFDFAGSKVSMVQEVEKNGRLYYRLWFTHGSFSVTNVPDYIDIPIDTLNKVTESGGDIILNGAELDFGIDAANKKPVQSLTSLPETAVEGDIVLLHRCNEISVDDSNSGVVLDTDALASLKLPEGITDRIWEFEAKNPSGTGFTLTLEQRVIEEAEPYILTGIFLLSENYGGRWYWRDGKPYDGIPNASADLIPAYIPLGRVDSFTATKDPLIDADLNEHEDTDNTVIFRTVPREYMYTDGGWKLAERTDEAEGSIIASVEEKNKDGRLFMRLNLIDSRNLKNRKTKKVVDIPVAGVKEFEETVDGITINGSEAEFEKNSSDSAKESITLIDRSTKKPYNLFISNGKLTFEERES